MSAPTETLSSGNAITPETLNATVHAFEALRDSGEFDGTVTATVAAHILHQIESLSGVVIELTERTVEKGITKTPVTPRR